MAPRSTTVWKIKGQAGIYEVCEWGETEVSQNDTITIGSLTSVANPYNVVLWKMSDGSEMTNTHAAGTNVVTITGAGTNVRCIYMAYGVKAS